MWDSNWETLTHICFNMREGKRWCGEESCCSAAQSCATLWDPMDCSTPGFPVFHHLPELAQTHQLMMPSNHLVLCHPHFLLPSLFPYTTLFRSYLTFWDPMDCSTPGFPVLHHLLELAQIHASQKFHIWISTRGNDTNKHPSQAVSSIMVS